MSSIIIVNYLLARDTAVKALVASNRIYPIQAPQNPGLPYIVTNKVSGKQHDLIDVPGKYYRDRVTIEGIATDALTAIKIGSAVMNCLEGVTKQAFTDYKDIDIRFADVDFSDQNDVQTAFRDVKQFFVWWRAKG